MLLRSCYRSIRVYRSWSAATSVLHHQRRTHWNVSHIQFQKLRAANQNRLNFQVTNMMMNVFRHAIPRIQVRIHAQKPSKKVFRTWMVRTSKTSPCFFEEESFIPCVIPFYYLPPGVLLFLFSFLSNFDLIIFLCRAKPNNSSILTKRCCQVWMGVVRTACKWKRAHRCCVCCRHRECAKWIRINQLENDWLRSQRQNFPNQDAINIQRCRGWLL